MPKADYGADIFLAVLDKRQNGHHGYSREKPAVRHFCQRLKALRGHAHIWLKLFAKLIIGSGDGKLAHHGRMFLYGKKNINITGHKRTF